ncbi:MAG: hypothetical protein LUH18_01745 [Oscillospiraceae bacterium]|nr:hypothetical protein [Oscillospiraceae bacterium]
MKMKLFGRRLMAVVIAAVILMSLTACGESDPVAGEDYILAARAEYISLDSARVDVVNDNTGESEQIFIYKYDEVGLMTYSYYAVSGDTVIAQYNNGYEQYTEENGVVTYLDTGDATFTSYSKDVPYPLADEGLIVFYKKAVNTETSYIATNELAIEVCHYYDISKLSGVDTADGMTGFKVLYYFDGDGNFLFLREVTEVTNDDGSITEYSYSIYITQQNEVGTVPNFIDITKVEEEDVGEAV